MLHTSQGRLFIDPHHDKQRSSRYQARTQQSAAATGYSCSVDNFAKPAVAANQSMLRPAAARIAGSFLRYQLAVSATKEYVAKVRLTIIMVSITYILHREEKYEDV